MVEMTSAAATAGSIDAVIEMRGITKRYGSVVANDDVDFDLRSGEIHALLGENGAGKTTLMRVLHGLTQADAGEIRLGGKRATLRSPRDALRERIGMVPQHLVLVPQLTVAQNVVLGTKSAWNLRLRQRDIERDVADAARRFGLDVEPSALVESHAIDGQQRVAILKLLYQGATALILDEPTAVLGPAQIEALFTNLRELRDQGRSIVVITHKLSEVTSIADRVTVLRRGHVVATASRGEFDERSLTLAMVGHELSPARTTVAAPAASEGALTLRELTVVGDSGHAAVDGVSLDVAAGEILGLAGVEGNGQRELAEALSGLRPVSSGEILVEGHAVPSADPLEMYRRNVGIVTEDRRRWDLVQELTLEQNLALSAIVSGSAVRCGFLQRGSMRRSAAALLREYDVRPPDPDATASSLSGGNQQKVVLARELSRDPRVLIAAQPTHGLDVDATTFVHQQLLRLRDTGSAVLLISLDLDELMQLSDRVAVLFRGRIELAGRAQDLSVGAIARAMAGLAPEPVT